MKKGFTLAEVLITLGIIGVIVAIMLPLINKARPVSEKAMYLKTYDSIVSTVHSLTNNKNAFPVTDEKHLDYSEYPLLNFGDGSLAGNPISGETKLQDAILMAFNANSTNTTPNGITLNIETKKDEKSNNDGYSGTYETTITFSLPNSKQDFTVYVYADGSVVPADTTGASYINTRTNWFFNKGKISSVKKCDKEYQLSCLSGYTFDAAQKTCKLSGEDDGESCSNTCPDGSTLDSDCNCIPNNSCTTEKQTIQDNNCRLQFKVSKSNCGGCGNCLYGTTEYGTCKTNNNNDGLFKWKATGYVTFRCTNQSVACQRNHNMGLWNATQNFEMTIIAAETDSKETKDKMVITNLQRNVGSYVKDNSDTLITADDCVCTNKTYIGAGNIKYEKLGSALETNPRY